MMRVASATAGDTLDASHERSLACTSCAWAGEATLPVPMAHTGSYATTTLDQSGTVLAYACGREAVGGWCATKRDDDNDRRRGRRWRWRRLQRGLARGACARDAPPAAT